MLLWSSYRFYYVLWFFTEEVIIKILWLVLEFTVVDAFFTFPVFNSYMPQFKVILLLLCSHRRSTCLR